MVLYILMYHYIFAIIIPFLIYFIGPCHPVGAVSSMKHTQDSSMELET